MLKVILTLIKTTCLNRPVWAPCRPTSSYVGRTRPRTMAIAMITIKNEMLGFPISICGYPVSILMELRSAISSTATNVKKRDMHCFQNLGTTGKRRKRARDNGEKLCISSQTTSTGSNIRNLAFL